MKLLLAGLLLLVGARGLAAAPASADLPLRVAYVTPAETQPAREAPATVFYDDFQAPPHAAASRYLEYSSADGSFVWSPDKGIRGGAMRCQFAKDQVTAGTLKVLFGRNPLGRGVFRDETFGEIYWRVYVLHETGWEGNPAKLARATCLAGENWSQGMIAHVWGGQGLALCIDPATGIRDNVKVTTRYNDFEHLKWLGSRMTQTAIFSPEESGRWVCVESHIKLNTPGRADGVFELRIDGRLEATRTNLNWHGTWNDYAINAVFLENYWNEGSVKRQARRFDDFVISRHPIGPILATSPPVIVRTLPAVANAWEIEVAGAPDGHELAWRSKPLPAAAVSVTVDSTHGEFVNKVSGETALAAGRVYWTRIRRLGDTDWSPWHAPFRQ